MEPRTQYQVKEKIVKPFSDEDRYWCIFYPDLPCPVQKRLKEFSLIDSLEPLKDDDNSVIAKAMKGMLKGSMFTLQALASFCSSCPHMRKRTYENTVSKPVEEVILGPLKLVPIQRSRESKTERMNRS